MRPLIKRICTIDGEDPENHRPQEPDRFAIVLRLFVGPSSNEGEESFDITVCTASWLSVECERDGFIVGRHHLIVLSYDFELIRRIIVKSVERCCGSTWHEVADKISRFGYWEFEDYRPSLSD